MKNQSATAKMLINISAIGKKLKISASKITVSKTSVAKKPSKSKHKHGSRLADPADDGTDPFDGDSPHESDDEDEDVPFGSIKPASTKRIKEEEVDNE